MKDIPMAFTYRLIRHMAESRHSTIRERWNSHPDTSTSGLMSRKKGHQELMSRQITRIRKGMFGLLCDSGLQKTYPVISEILDEDIIELKKSCMIMLLLGFDKKTTADLHCINTLYIDLLCEEFPDYFK
jgi:hypothetical protein